MKMNRSIGILTALLVCLLQWQDISGECDFDGAARNQIDFPDIMSDAEDPGTKLPGYELSVEFTISNKDIKETQYFKEYYDIINGRGRLDMVASGKSSKSYYFKESEEGFDIKGETCTYRDPKELPDQVKPLVSDWNFGDVKGPSAMLLKGLDEWKNNPNTMKYMGEIEAGNWEDFDLDLKTHYWRRCNDRQVVDYYFTTNDHDDTFGFGKLKNLPLRVHFYNVTQDEKFFPQTYEILSFKPYVSDIINTFRIPSGIGCKRLIKDVPTVPDFSSGNLMTWGEASYVYGYNDDEIWNYYSTFMFAQDLGIQHMAYFYSPWGSVKESEQTADGYMHIVYDLKNQYVYSRNLATGECSISRDPEFKPQYYLPKSGDSIALTDPMMLFPNNEFSYISDGKDRGFDVHTFEAIMKDFPLGKRTVPKLLVNHNYLKEEETIDNNVPVINRTLSMRLRFYADAAKSHSEELTVSLYGFTTELQFRQYIFGMKECFKNDDDYLYLVIGFNADPSVMDKIKTEVPSLHRNILNDIIRITELNPLRIASMMTDFADMVYVTIMLLNKPPVTLDFLEPEPDKTIIGAQDVEGVISSEDCATACLETKSSCWGFAYCGSTCYFGTGNVNVNVTDKKGCSLYRRYNVDSFVPSKESAAQTIRELVAGNQLRVALPNIVDDNQQPFFLEASFFSITNPGESDEMFDRLGQKKRTDPRLRVVKAGSKLVAESTGEVIKNFGSLRYDQCQSLCLDYKKCQTVSYCVKNSECVLSVIYGDDLPQDKIKEDNTCSLLTRKYTDNFERSAGNVISETALKTLDDSSPEKCARACLSETSFGCMSFDVCPDAKTKGCRLHAVSYLDKASRETKVTKDPACAHFFKTYSNNFRKEDNKKSLGGTFEVATNETLEQCAKLCMEYTDGACYGYDFCGDKFLAATTCTLLIDDPGKYATAYSPICTHYLQVSLADPNIVPESKAAWVGVVCFFVAAIVGVLLFWGIAYFRANRAQ